MATFTAAMEMLERGTLHLWSWRNLKLDDAGSSVEWSRLSDRSVHVYGTWGGASLVMEGSNDDTNMAQLDNLRGVAISVSANAIFGILQIAAYVRPRVVGGDATTNLNVIMLSRGSK